MTSLHVLITAAKYLFLFVNFSWRYTQIAGFLRFLNSANWTPLKNKVEGVCNSHKLRGWQVSSVCQLLPFRTGYLWYMPCRNLHRFFYPEEISYYHLQLIFSVLLSLPGLSENYFQLNRSCFCGERKKNSHHFKRHHT